ncbi:unnamed protein product [Lymnaea stagnalis]|uniref:Immunoglobulin domain-containing protein n=1 Tax=Lymnaea stagnalis TaxID=6523 RepID=A0AAV2HJ39_LYMST
MKETIVVFYCLSSIIFNPGQGFLNILDKSTVEEGEIFTMTCDYLRFDYTNEMIDYVLAVHLRRKLVNTSEESVLCIFNPTFREELHYIKKFPPGRNWDVWGVAGGDVNTGQKEKVTLSIAVLDTTIADSGNYTCVMEYSNIKLELMRRSEFLTVTKSTYSKPIYTRRTTRKTAAPTNPTTNSPVTKAVGNQPILDKSTVVEGESFTMTCDYKRFEIVNSGIDQDDYINRLQLSRLLEGSSKYSLVYRYCPRHVTNNRISGFPPGRSWHVHIDQGDHEAIQEFIRLTVTVNDTIYSDSGSYECDVLFGTQRQNKRNETLTVIKAETDPTAMTVSECQDLELTTTGIQIDSADNIDKHHSVLLLLYFVLPWLLD